MHRRTVLLTILPVVAVLGLIAQQSGFLDSEVKEETITQKPRERPIYERVPGPPLCRDWYVRCGYQGMSKAVCEREYLACLHAPNAH